MPGCCCCCWGNQRTNDVLVTVVTSPSAGTPGSLDSGGIRGQMMSWSPLRQLGHRGGWTLRTAGYWPNLLCGILITYYLLLYFVRWYYKAYNQICTIHTDCIVLHWLCQNMFLFSFQLKIVCLRPFQIFMSSLLCEFCLSEADIVMLSY